MSDGRTRLRRVCLTLALLAAAWSLVLALTHGVVLSLGPLHVSSRNVRNPILAALLLLAGALLCAPAGARVPSIAADLRAWRDRLRTSSAAGTGMFSALLRMATHPRLFPVYVALLIGLMMLASWTRGAYVAGGADSYGYVSEAHLFATGRLRTELPLGHAFPHVPVRAMTPLGYVPDVDDRAAIVPMYAPGLPLTMAAAERLAGMNAVYAVMPLLAALAIWCTYRLGRQLAGPATGLGAALLICTSPAFLFQLLGAPMSDIPAAAWWTLALTLVLKAGRWSAVGAGVAAGLAILTRPNLLAVVVALGVYLLWLLATDREHRRARLTAIALFSLPVVAACLVVAALNDAWYGSPFRSGYSADLFNLSFWTDNVLNYPRWLIESQTPLLLVGFAAPFVVHWRKPDGAARRPEAWLLAGVAVAVFASYLFYQPFAVWWFLRFLLPGFPALAVLTCVALAAVASRFGVTGRSVAIAVVIAAAIFGYRYEKDTRMLGEYRYRIIGEWVRDHLPQRSIILAMQHSGSVRHYSGRTTVRYDLLEPDNYEPALDEMIHAAYHPYLVVDPFEVEQVRQRNGSRAALDWPPIAVLPLGDVTVWDLAEDREAARRSGRQPVVIAVPAFITEHPN